MDRNLSMTGNTHVRNWSLSARRAWIEMLCIAQACLESAVALRKESVDRNMRFQGLAVCVQKSLSARRAWIEIGQRHGRKAFDLVALRKESVDRNFDTMQIVIVVVGRSPQGERG